MELRVFVSAEKERTEEIGGAGVVHITELRTMATIIINTKAKSALIVPPPAKPPVPPVQEGVEKFIDRAESKNGLATLSMGLKTATGKEWMVQTSCRPDGIWVARKIKTPQGLMTMTQGDIQIVAVPVTQFEVPSDYKIVQAPAQPTDNNR